MATSNKIPIIKVNQINFSQTPSENSDKKKSEQPQIQKFHVFKMGEKSKTTPTKSNEKEQKKQARAPSAGDKSS